MPSLRYLLPIALLVLAFGAEALAQIHAAPTAQRLARSAQPSATVARVAIAEGAPTELYSHGDPTSEEQYLLELVNRARANPAAEGNRLIMTPDPGVSQHFEAYGVDTARVRAEFATYPSRPPLAFNAKLIDAARRHNEDMRRNNFQDHRGFDGSTFDQRIREAGYGPYTAIAENISAYARNLWFAHVGFNIDWGNPDLGHRHNIMNFAANDSIYREFGAAVIDLKRAPLQDSVGPLIVTEEFAKGPAGPFLLGVVYHDANTNGFYDVGEGLPGVHVTPSSGTYYAITSASGGYAIPVKDAGSSFTVTFAHGPLAKSYVRDVTIGGANVKLDLSPMALPAAVVTVRPAANGLVTTDTARFVWRRPAPAVDRYHLQIARDSLMASIVVDDTTVVDTARAVLGLASGERYFWRVAAHNPEGWGEFGAAQSFRFVLPPAAVTLVEPGESVQGTDITFSWQRPAGPVTAYGFELAYDESMTAILAADSTIVEESTVVRGVQPDRYHWRVRAKNEAGWGPYSEVRSLQAIAAGVDDESIAARSLRVYPNRFESGALVTIDLDVATARVASIDVVDALGRIVDANVEPLPVRMLNGTASAMVAFEALATGRYFVRVRTTDGRVGVASITVIAGTR